MGIFDEAETSLIAEMNPPEIARRLSEDLLAMVKRDNIAMDIAGGTVRLLSESRETLDISCDGRNAFRLVDCAGHHSDRFLPQKAHVAPKSMTDRHCYTQTEMTTAVKAWLREQRS